MMMSDASSRDSDVSVAERGPVDFNVWKDLESLGDPTLVSELATLYLDNAPRQVSKIQASADTGAWEALKKEAHSLKSSSASVGAIRMSKICKDLESDPSGDQVSRWVIDLAEELERVREAINQELLK